MKYLYLIICAFIVQNSLAQQTIPDTFMHDGIERSYILYVPAIYDANAATPLVFNFHGYTSNAAAQMFYGDFRPIADTANFLVVHPMGTEDNNGQPYWNANWGGAVDDIGFTSALIDRIASNYNIDLNRVYSTGMSNGGFMSYALACDLSDRIAAIASVTGTMLSVNLPACNPSNLPVPAMQIHGTADGVVPYNGSSGAFGFEPIEDVIDFWLGNNACSSVSPAVTAVPDIDPTDGCTAEHYFYDGCSKNTTIEFFKVLGGGHTWPGSPFGQGVTCQDFNASMEIWRFFSQYDINGKVITSQPEIEKSSISFGPVPFQDQLIVKSNDFTGTIRITDASGQQVLTQEIQNGVEYTIPSAHWSAGLYIVESIDQTTQSKRVEKIVKVN